MRVQASQSTGTKYRKYVAVVLMAVMMGAASVTRLGGRTQDVSPGLTKARLVLVLLTVVVLALMARCRPRPFPRSSFPILLLWEAFVVLSAAAFVVNHQPVAAVKSLWLMIIVPVVFFNIVPNLFNRDASVAITSAFALGHAPYILLSLLTVPISGSYRGILGNANQMGLICALFFACQLAALADALLSKHQARLSLVAASMIPVVVLAIASSSRTSLLTMGIIFLVFAYINRACFIASRNAAALTLVAGTIVVAVGVVGQHQLSDFIAQSLLRKTIPQLHNIMPFRREMWAYALENVSLWGHGEGYFWHKFSMRGLNTYIEILGERGLLAAGAFIGFCVMSLRHTWLYATGSRATDRWRQAPLYITTFFVVSSITEGMLGNIETGLTLLFFLAVGVVATRARAAPTASGSRVAS